MKNTVNIAGVIDAVYALSQLKSIMNDPTLPGPFGRNDEEALRSLAMKIFSETCAELGAEADGESVILRADVHDLLQAAVTDRTLAELCMRPERPDIMRRLRCRLRPLPPKRAARY